VLLLIIVLNTNFYREIPSSTQSVMNGCRFRIKIRKRHHNHHSSQI